MNDQKVLGCLEFLKDTIKEKANVLGKDAVTDIERFFEVMDDIQEFWQLEEENDIAADEIIDDAIDIYNTI